MFAMKCDLCGIVQVKEKPHEIEGTTYMEGSVQKFACTKCKSLMEAAFEIKKDGLRKPLSKIAGLVEQRDKARRERDEAMAALRGKNPFAAVVVGNPKKALEPPKGAASVLLGFAHSEFKILKVVRLGGDPPEFVVVVQERGRDGRTYNVRGGAPMVSSAEIFRKAVHEASGGALGNADLPQQIWDQMLSSAPKMDAPKKRGKKDQ